MYVFALTLELPSCDVGTPRVRDRRLHARMLPGKSSSGDTHKIVREMHVRKALMQQRYRTSALRLGIGLLTEP